MKNKLFTSAVIMFTAIGLLAFARSSFAANTSQTNWGQKGNMERGQFERGQHIPGVMGVVSVIKGSNLTIQSHSFGPNSATTTYSIDASKAIVIDKGATSTLSAIAIGNPIAVEGTVNGTSVIATKINIGGGFGRINGERPNIGPRGASSTAKLNMLEGNGEPVIGGTVSMVSGTTITITNKSNTTYSIDASSATITKNNATATASDIVVGDSVLVQGSINGTSVIASTITDHVPAVQNSNNVKTSSSNPVGSFFGGIKGFFSRLFGF